MGAAGISIPAVLPPIDTVFNAVLSSVDTIFDAGLVAVSRSGAGREKRASRRDCYDERERLCDPLAVGDIAQ